jgi:hypothetical protein
MCLKGIDITCQLIYYARVFTSPVEIRVYRVSKRWSRQRKISQVGAQCADFNKIIHSITMSDGFTTQWQIKFYLRR